MKLCIAFTLTVAAAFDSAMGLSTYLKELPNGDSFSQELGHPDNDSSQYTKFATAFAAAGHSWTTDFCGETFPGSDMTNGAAFGDPCCTWTKGGTPDFTVTAFTTTPGEATVCASMTDTTETPETTEPPATEAPAAYTPSTTKAPSATAPPVTDSPATTDAPAYTDAPAATTAPTTIAAPATTTPFTGGCAVKPDSATLSYRRLRH